MSRPFHAAESTPASARPAPVRWWRSLRFRLALSIALCFLGLSLAGDWFVRRYEDQLYPEWYDSRFLRGRARAIDRAEAGEITWDEVYERFPDSYESVLYPQVLAVTAVLSLAAAAVVALLATRRLERLHRQASTPADDAASLPGPFAVTGHDEIAALATALNTMRAEVTGLLEQLEERDRWRREWIAQVAHDLRTPLAALSACLERAEAAADPALTETLEVAQLDCTRIGELTEDLLESARLEADDCLRIEPVPAGELLRRTVSGLSRLADQHEARITLDLDGGLPVLAADGARLTRVLENLLRNALQQGAKQIRVSARLRGPELVLEIRDDGPGLGLPLAMLLPLDQLLVQLRQRGSLGIGLQVVDRIVRLHGGRAEAENPASGGSVFRIALPTGSNTA